MSEGDTKEPALAAVREALALLSNHDTVEADDGAGLPALPLPSLLERCEALLVQEAAPERMALLVAHGFALPQPARLVEYLGVLPNLVAVSHLLPAPLAQGSADAPGRVDPALQARLAAAAQAGALAQLQGEALLRGLRPFLLVDRGAHYLAPHPQPEPPMPEWGALDALEMVAVVHPLLAYLVLRDASGGAPGALTLEAFAQRMTRFLDDHAELPVLACDRIAADPAASLAQVAQSWKLALGAQTLSRARILPPDTLNPVDATLLARIAYRDGSPVIEQPLDSPAYGALCQRLGYDPLHLSGTGQPLTMRETAGQRAALPRRAAKGRAPALVSDFVELLGRVMRRGESGQAAATDISALVERIDDCVAQGDGFLDALDRQIEIASPESAALLKFAAAAHFLKGGQTIHGLSFLAEGAELLPSDARGAALAGAELYLKAGRTELALRLLLADAFDPRHGLEATAREALEATLRQSFGTKTGGEHGQALLIDRLNAHPPADGRPRVMIEVGTTRESVPGQGSTEKLARLCAALGIDFITVDMDPRNSANARRMFRRLGLPFQAVTDKGEDFLASYQGTIDYVFLDAYDFDHGQHSELRQSRYEAFLGSRIEEAQCHQMHLDCSLALRDKLSDDGLICFDDTWRDSAGKWTAKGTTAMPYLLRNGFELIEARNRAALLRRG